MGLVGITSARGQPDTSAVNEGWPGGSYRPTERPDLFPVSRSGAKDLKEYQFGRWIFGSRTMPRKTLTEIGLLTVISLIIFVTFLGSARLWDRDEPRNAGCAREMLERGDWIVPTFNGELRAHKPVLLYWLIMAAYSVVGVSEFSARISSAILGTGTVLVTYWLGRRLLPGAGGFWAGTSLATMVLFAVSSRSVTPDAGLIFFSTLGIACFVAGYFPPARTEVVTTSPAALPPRSNAGGNPRPEASGAIFPACVPLVWAAGMYLAWGLATLAKGPVGFVLPAAVVMIFLVSQQLVSSLYVPGPVAVGENRPRPWLRVVARAISPGVWWRAARTMRLGWGMALVLGVAGPWYLLVTLQTQGAFLQEFFLRHHLERALTPFEGHHGSIFFYPVALLVGTFPWSVFAVPCFLAWRSDWRGNQRLQAAGALLLIWIGVYMGVFTLAQTKLPSYQLPCYPAVALVVGHYLGRLPAKSTPEVRAWTIVALLVLLIVGIAAAVALPIVALRLFGAEMWMGLVGAILAGGAVAGWWTFVYKDARVFLRAMVITACAFVHVVVAVAPARVSQYRWLEGLLEEFGRSSTSVAAVEFCEPSWVFYRGERIPIYTRENAEGIARALSGGVLLVRENIYQEINRSLPPHVVVVTGPRFLREEKVLLLTAPEAIDQRGRPIAESVASTTGNTLR